MSYWEEQAEGGPLKNIKKTLCVQRLFSKISLSGYGFKAGLGEKNYKLKTNKEKKEGHNNSAVLSETTWSKKGCVHVFIDKTVPISESKL